MELLSGKTGEFELGEASLRIQNVDLPDGGKLILVEDRSRGFSLGASDFLVKPVDRDALLRVLARLGVNITNKAVCRRTIWPRAVKC